MTVAEVTSKRAETADHRESVGSLAPPFQPASRRRRRLIPFLITLAAIALAVPLAWAMWNAYMASPWTRDGTVRAYVVNIAPQVADRIVKLPVTDNQFVHKGELLLAIDQTNYEIAIQLAEAALRQAEANAQTIDAQISVQQAQVSASQAQVEQAQAALTFAEEQAARYQDLAQRQAGTVLMAEQTASTLRQDQAVLKNSQDAVTVAERQIESLKAQRSTAEAAIGQARAQRNQAWVNLARTEIRSPVNGWITNLVAQVGDYAPVGQSLISIVDADSFWVDAYFEETQLASIHEGDPAQVKLMTYSQIIEGKVGSVARAITVSNALPGQQGLANVNPIFTWVRLAQRVPVRIRIDRIPDGVRLTAGMTATVQVNRPRPAGASN